MATIKPDNWKISEIAALITVYAILIINAVVLKDRTVAVFSAFFGITYTMLAGKGNPKCYLFGIAGSGLYGWLALTNALWGNLALYMLYYIPMQITGFFKWNQNLKEGKKEIVKTCLSKKEALILSTITTLLTISCIFVLYITHDNSPVIDGITTIFSIAGMYLTVKRCVEQWLVWIIVNGLTAIMWINIALSGEKVYSAVVMWVVYFLLAIYFNREWRKEFV